MKKVSLVVMEKEHVSSLEKLREAGVVHLEKKNVSSVHLDSLLERQAKIYKALGVLRRYVPKNASPCDVPSVPVTDMINRILALSDEKKTLQDGLSQNAREIQRMQSWGDFDPHSFAVLEQNGVTLVPYELSLKNYSLLAPETEHIVLSKDKRTIRILAVGEAIPGLVPFKFSACSISGIENLMEKIRKRITDIETELEGFSFYKKNIEEEKDLLLEDIEFERAKAGMASREDASLVSWLSGFVPADKVNILKKEAEKHGWALLLTDPAPKDRPPTLVRNNAAVRIIQPLFSFLGTVPGYREYDISPSYLVFLCLFFAMIFGDACYGLLLFAASVVSGFVFKKKTGQFPDASKLFILLSLCTVTWGTITGSWFAIPADNLPPVLRSLIIPPFNNTGELAQFPAFLQKLFSLPAEVPAGDLKTRWNIQFLCFTVGAAQLIWARGKNVFKLLPSLTALAQAGWLLLMTGLYFLVLSMLLKLALPPFAVWLIGIGIVFYFIFAEQNGGNFIKNIIKSFTNFLSIFLNLVSSFADIISYIRLFAVGLAGSIIAQSFNDMAIPAGGFGSFGFGFIVRLLAAVLILVFGHALNMAMNALSVIVHGIRLNLLEYAGNHLGMEWSGYAYKPFELKQKNTEKHAR